MVHVSRQALPARLGLVVLLVALMASTYGVAAAQDPPLLPPGQIPGETYPTPTPPDILSPIEDSDGDGIPNAQDPDDDNGGTSDEDDPAPFDPVIEPTPQPDILSPIEDNDDDGIPNIQDPDDDNDGGSDDEDPAPFVPGKGEPDPTPTPSDPVVETDPGVPAGSDETPVVTRLPVTGTGQDQEADGWRLVWTIAIAGAAYVGLGVLATVHDLRAQRQKVR